MTNNQSSASTPITSVRTPRRTRTALSRERVYKIHKIAVTTVIGIFILAVVALSFSFFVADNAGWSTAFRIFAGIIVGLTLVAVAFGAIDFAFTSVMKLIIGQHIHSGEVERAIEVNRILNSHDRYIKKLWRYFKSLLQ